jgi:hypothetical protein
MLANLALNFLLLATVVLYIAIAAILVRQYLRTRDVGFVWLAVALFIWPVISRLLEWGEKVLIGRLIHNQPVGFYPFTLVASGQMSIGSLVASFAVFQQFIGVCLLLVAILYLSRAKNYPLRPIA